MPTVCAARWAAYRRPRTLLPPSVRTTLGTADVRRNAREYVSSLRDLLVGSVQGQWSDATKQSRSQLFVSMIADVNPGNEPVGSGAVDEIHQVVPPPTGGGT